MNSHEHVELFLMQIAPTTPLRNRNLRAKQSVLRSLYFSLRVIEGRYWGSGMLHLSEDFFVTMSLFSIIILPITMYFLKAMSFLVPKPLLAIMSYLKTISLLITVSVFSKVLLLLITNRCLFLAWISSFQYWRTLSPQLFSVHDSFKLTLTFDVAAKDDISFPLNILNCQCDTTVTCFLRCIKSMLTIHLDIDLQQNINVTLTNKHSITFKV